jgi:NAD(P)H-dependent flavin oxidoreductase YrpB (nitropropane dioxygenase family)
LEKFRRLKLACLNDYRVTFRGKEYVPLMVGGMGTNISSAEMVLAVEKLGGIAHLSDAMLMDVADRVCGTKYIPTKTMQYAKMRGSADKKEMHFDLAQLEEATKKYIGGVMEKATGKGLVFLNVMEKLTMNDPMGTLKVRLNAALDAGIQGITLSAGLHLASFKLMSENPRFREVLLGFVVSSVRALNLILKRTASLERLPDYIVVEGPKAGGHLGFGEDWAEHNVEDIVREVKAYLKEKGHDIPVFVAGGVFTGGDATRMIEEVGADGVQVATRFVITQECGMPAAGKYAYLNAVEEDIEVNHLSPTGYLMRMLKNTPAKKMVVPPNCEPFGFLLNQGMCPYLKQWNQKLAGATPEEIGEPMCCLCTHMKLYNVWTCGATTYRLKETTVKLPNGTWYLPTCEQVYRDYLFSTGDDIMVAQPQE